MKRLRYSAPGLVLCLVFQALILPLQTCALPTKSGVTLKNALGTTAIPYRHHRYEFSCCYWFREHIGTTKRKRRVISIMAHSRDAMIGKITHDGVISSTNEKSLASPSTGVFLRLCPKCNGEGKLSKAVSKKARLRKQRRMYQEKQKSEQENIQCDNGKRIKRMPSDTTSSSTTSERDSHDISKKREEELQLPKTLRRWDPCSKCDQSGLLISSNITRRRSFPSSITTTHKRPFVAIVGGGIGGIALAVALQHRGIPYMVYEKDSRFDQRRQGYGLTLQQARRALQALGIFEKDDVGDVISNISSKLLEEHAVTSTKHVVHTPDGNQVGEWGLRRWVREDKDTKNTPKNSGENGSGICEINRRNGISIDERYVDNNTTTNCNSKPSNKSTDKGTSTRMKPRTTSAKNRKRRQNLHIPRQTLRRALLEALKEASCLGTVDVADAAKLLAVDTNCTKSVNATSTKCLSDDDYRSLNISWGHKLVSIEPVVPGPFANGVKLSFETIDECGSGRGIVTSQASLVVGCDGIRSSVREQLFCANADGNKKLKTLDAKQPDSSIMGLRYLKCVVILGICSLGDLFPHEMGDNQEETTQKQKQKQIELSPLLDGETVFQTADGTTRIYLMPYSKKNNEYMWQLSFPVLDEDVAIALSKRGPKALKEEALRRCQSWHVPIPDILNTTPVELVSGYPVYDRDILTADSLSDSRKYMTKPIATLGDGKKQNITSNHVSFQNHSTSLFVSFPITLLGDAAHPMSPFKGQGANQALLDALSLARSLYRIHCCEGRSLEEVLKHYESEMLDRSAKKVRASSAAAQFLHTDIAIQEGDVTRGAAAAVVNSASFTIEESKAP